MENILCLKCLICGKRYRPDGVDYVCPERGNEGILDVIYDYDFIGRQFSKKILLQSNDFSIWRYQPLLPVDPKVAGPAVLEVLVAIMGPADQFRGFMSATGSAGTIACGDFLKKQFPTSKIAASEALQCPTLLRNGFGEHCSQKSNKSQ